MFSTERDRMNEEEEEQELLRMYEGVEEDREDDEDMSSRWDRHDYWITRIKHID